MRLLVGDTEVPFTSLKIRDSIKQFSTLMEVECAVPFIANCTLDYDGTKLQFYAHTVKSAPKQCTVFCTSLNVHTLNRVFPAFRGTATLKELLEHFSVEYSLFEDTASQYWEIPTLKFKNWVNFIRYKVNTGSAPAMTFNMFGHLHCFDLKSRYEAEPMMSLEPHSLEMNLTSDWERNVPLSIKVTHDTVAQTTTKVVEQSDKWGKSNLSWLTTNDKLVELREMELLNKMGHTMYTAQNVHVVSQQIIPVLGSTYKLNEGNMVLTEVIVYPTRVEGVLSSPRYQY